MDDRRVRLESRIQQLIEAGKTPDEIRGMRDQLRAEMNDPEGGARQQLGPTPAGSPDPTSYRSPTNPLEAVQQSKRGILGRAADAVIKGGVSLRDFPGQFAANPRQGLTAMGEGAAQAMMPGYDARGMAEDQDARAARYRAGTNTVQDDTYGMSAHGRPPGSPPRTQGPDMDRVREVEDAVAAQPGAAMFGGAVAPSPEMLATAGLSKILPISGGALGRVARSALIGGGVGAASGTGRALAHGEGLPDALEAGAVGGLSAAPLAAATTGLGELAVAGKNAVVNSKGGQARQLIESQGGNVGPLDSGSGGPFAAGGPLAGKKPTSRDVGTASRDSAGKVLRGMEGDLKESLKGPIAEKAQLDAENKGHIVVNDLVSEMQKLQAGELLSSGEQATVEGWLKRLDSHAVKVNGEPSGVYAMTPKALNEFRTMLDGATGAGEAPGTVAKAKMQGVAGVARGLVDQTDYGPVNAKIHGARTKYEGDRRLLGLDDRQATGAMAPEGVPNSEINRVTNMMARQGQNTVTAGGQNTAGTAGAEGVPPGLARERLDQLAERSPQYRRDINMPRTLEAKGDLTARLFPDSDRGGLLDRVKSVGTSPVGAGLLAGGGSAAAGHPGIAALLAALGLIGQNAAPIEGRLLYTPARAAGAMGEALSGSAGQLSGYSPVLLNELDAALERKRRGKEKRP